MALFFENYMNYYPWMALIGLILLGFTIYYSRPTSASINAKIDPAQEIEALKKKVDTLEGWLANNDVEIRELQDDLHELRKKRKSGNEE